MPRHPAVDWLYVIVSGHILMNGVALLVVLVGLLLYWAISPLLAVLTGLIVGGVMIFAFPVLSYRIVFKGRARDDRRGEDYLVLLGFATMALCFVGVFITGGLVKFMTTDVIEGVSPEEIPSYRGENVFLDVVNERVVYRLAGTHRESRRNPDGTARTDNYYAAPMFHREVSIDQINARFRNGDVCLWVTSREGGSAYLEVPTSRSYLQAARNALGGLSPSCEPIFLMPFESSQAAIDRAASFLKVLLLVCNVVPILLAAGFGIRRWFTRGREKPAQATGGERTGSAAPQDKD